MSTAHTISEAAARSGFTASALRFYENAGLITPDRTDAGYRIYDDRSVERLRFISRAKQLGLSLEEITELVALWDGEQCTPVAGRLRDLVEEKLRDTRERIAELVTFAGDLQGVSASLVEPSDGPCGDDCACNATSPAAVAVPLVAKLDAGATPPIACTLAPDQAAQRLDGWRRLFARSSERVEIEGGVALWFPAEPELAATVGALAAAEQACCSFFAFTIRIDHTGTELTITGPGEARLLIDALVGAAA